MDENERLRTFSSYMEKIEQRIMIPCVVNGTFKNKIMVSVKKSKFLGTDFGDFVGEVFEDDRLIAFNYYGMVKISTAYVRKVQKLENQGVSVKSLECSVAYFSAIKMSHLDKYAPELIEKFSRFKEFLVKLRAFPASGEARK